MIDQEAVNRALAEIKQLEAEAATVFAEHTRLAKLIFAKRAEIAVLRASEARKIARKARAERTDRL